MPKHPPYRIETKRLVIRCLNPRDAPLLKDAIDASLDHLRPWMPWARDESEVVGGTGLHTRVGNEAFEIGYWISASRARQGLATEAVGALAKVAFDVSGVERVEIHVDPENTASLGVPRKLGFEEEATLRRRIPAVEGGRRDEVVFSLFRDEHEDTPVAAARLTAFDAARTRVL